MLSKLGLGAGNPVERFVGMLLSRAVDLTDIIIGPLQRLLGVRRMPYFFVTPNLLIFGIFILFPMMLNFYYTFTGSDRLFLEDRPWVGTENLEQIFSCENYLDPNSCKEDLFWRAAQNTAVFVVSQVGLLVLVSLMTAVALNRKIAGRGFFRSVFFYPVLLSPIVVALIWRWILQENGLLNAMLGWFSIEQLSFITKANWARFWIVVISVWAYMGFYTLILLAGLQAIPQELYEAAAMDGANAFVSFIRVTLPLLMPSMLVVLVLSVIRAVQVFDIVWAFTGGGPGSATLYMVQYIYNHGFASATKEYGLSAAASMVMATVLLVFTLLQLRLSGAQGTEGDA